jgi:hypothetical protein
MFFALVFRTNFWRQVMFQLGAKNLYEKCVQKSNASVNFINALQAAFA